MGPKKDKKKQAKPSKKQQQEKPKKAEKKPKAKKAMKSEKKEKIIEKFRWTRVVNRTQLGTATVKLFDGLEDLAEAEQMQDDEFCYELPSHEFLFHPEAFEDEDWERKLPSCQPSPTQLRVVAERVSKVRQRLLERANLISSEEQPLDDAGIKRIESLKKKLYRSKLSASELTYLEKPDFDQCEDIPCRKYKKRRLSQISIEERQSILMKVFVDKVLFEDIAREFRVTKAQISYLVSKATRNPDYVDELRNIQLDKDTQVNSIIDTAEKMMKNRNSMANSSDIQHHMIINEQTPAPKKEICKVLREEFQMKYKDVHKVQPYTNSARSLVLRSRYAYCQLELMEIGKRIINVDESTIGESNFLRRSWQGKAYAVSQPISLVRPRVSLICAIDTEGLVYWSLLQTNTNDRTFGMYLQHLVAKLDEDRPGWRTDSIVQLDGAPYHKSDSTLKLLHSLQVPFIISAPYSFDASPIELYFSRLKYGVLNPNNNRMIKSKWILY